MTLSYDVNTGDNIPFNPENLKLWQIALSNPARISNHSVLPPFTIVSVVPQVPANIELE